MALSCLRAQTYVSQSTASPTASGVSVARAAPALRCPSLAKPKHRWTNADTSRLHVRHAYSQSSIVASADPGAAVPFPTLQGRETLSLRPQETTFDLNGLLLAHAAIRGDCEIILDALSKVDLSRKEPYAGVLKPVLNQFFALLEVHHDIEDNVMFPSLLQLPMPLPGIPAADLASLKPGPETAALNAATPFWTDMVDEHSALLRHLAWVQEGLSLFEVAERQDDPPSVIDIILGRAKQREAEQLARRQAAFDELKSRLTAAINQCLLPHLLKEELTIPQMFRLRMTEAELAEVEKACGAEGGRLEGPILLAWMLHHMTPANREKFLAHVPPPAKAAVDNVFGPKLRAEYYQPLLDIIAGAKTAAVVKA